MLLCLWLITGRLFAAVAASASTQNDGGLTFRYAKVAFATAISQMSCLKPLVKYVEEVLVPKMQSADVTPKEMVLLEALIRPEDQKKLDEGAAYITSSPEHQEDKFVQGYAQAWTILREIIKDHAPQSDDQKDNSSVKTPAFFLPPKQIIHVPKDCFKSVKVAEEELTTRIEQESKNEDAVCWAFATDDVIKHDMYPPKLTVSMEIRASLADIFDKKKDTSRSKKKKINLDYILQEGCPNRAPGISSQIVWYCKSAVGKDNISPLQDSLPVVPGTALLELNDKEASILSHLSLLKSLFDQLSLPFLTMFKSDPDEKSPDAKHQSLEHILDDFGMQNELPRAIPLVDAFQDAIEGEGKVALLKFLRFFFEDYMTAGRRVHFMKRPLTVKVANEYKGIFAGVDLLLVLHKEKSKEIEGYELVVKDVKDESGANYLSLHAQDAFVKAWKEETKRQKSLEIDEKEQIDESKINNVPETPFLIKKVGGRDFNLDLSGFKPPEACKTKSRKMKSKKPKKESQAGKKTTNVDTSSQTHPKKGKKNWRVIFGVLSILLAFVATCLLAYKFVMGKRKTTKHAEV